MQDKLRKLQLTQLEILKVIDELCKKHKISYSLYAGTLLGAVRHKGFIPWDDDIDICMSRKNYNRFIQVWNAERPEGYLLQNKDNTPNFSQSFSKIRKDHTTFWQKGESCDKYHIGIFVDIFPIDKMPNGKINRILFQLQCILYQLYTREHAPINGSRIEKNISNILLKAVPRSKHTYVRKLLEKKILRHNRCYTNDTIAIEILSTIKTPLPSNLLNNYTYLQFEDREFMCFAQWDTYLKLKFGDYMQLPPEKDRGWKHKPLCLDFERNYDEIITPKDKGKPIRILHVIGEMDRGGAETMIMNLYRNIDREKIQFDFMVHTTKKCAYDDEIRSLGGRIYHVPKFNGANFISYINSWRRFLKKHDEHPIIHGHIGSSAALYLSVAKRYGRFAIAHSHNTKSTIKSVRTKLWELYSFPTRFVADYFLGCGQQAGIDRFGKKIADSKKYSVLNNAIDSALFTFSDISRKKIREELKITDKFVVGHVGRFENQKNHDFLIDIFRLVHEKCSNAVLLLIGDGSRLNEVKTKVRGYNLSDSVIFTGVRDDVSSLLSAMDVFVFPSLYEGLGIVAVESQAAGLHTICSDVVPTEARVTDLFHPISLSQSTEKWADTILKYVNGYERRNMYNEIIKAGYDIHTTAKCIENFYLKLNSEV